MIERLPPLRDRLRKAAHALGVPIDVVEFDYGLSYVLAAIFARASRLRGCYVRARITPPTRTGPDPLPQ